MENLRILEYEPALQPWFEKLNRDWIEKYFTMESIDEEVVKHPEEKIIKSGGAILFAASDGQIVGTVALKNEGDGVIELCKMAVDENFRGKRTGLFLGEAALKKSKALGAKKVILYSQTTFNSGIAINLYNRLGFKEVELEKGGYERCNIKMLFDFETHDYLERMGEWLKKTVTDAIENFRTISENEWNHKASVSKWSKKEIIGHLIDSASNNHQRFVRAQYNESLVFPRYHQNEFVAHQNYQHQQARFLTEFWQHYNLQLAWVIKNIHPEKLHTSCTIGDNEPCHFKIPGRGLHLSHGSSFEADHTRLQVRRWRNEGNRCYLQGKSDASS
jgi:N-acetylglutamate synthase-like GNAT family acetyltransferase